MKSIFSDKNKKPTETDLKKALAETYDYWKELSDFTKRSFTPATSDWHFSGEKHGWNFRVSDKKRVLIYLLPRDKFFKTAFVFGQKATNEILDSNISDSIKNELKAAKVYAEGRGIRIEIKNKTAIEDIKKLIAIKIAH